MCDDLSVLENQNIENLTRNDEENMEMDKINEVTSYKRKQFKAGVDFRKTLGSFCKKLIKLQMLRTALLGYFYIYFVINIIDKAALYSE